MPSPSRRLSHIQRQTERLPSREGFVRLDRNERVTPFREEVFREMLATLDAGLLTTYPDASRLYSALSSCLGISEDRIYVTPGSDGAIRLLMQAYVEPGDRVVLPKPTYAMYRIYADVLGASVVNVRYDDAFALDRREMLAAITAGAKVVAIANPNQPLGTLHAADEIEAYCEAAAAADALVIVDEAYYPFSRHTAIGLIERFDNLVVTRTFSKASGLAGLRIGYLAGSADIVRAVEQVRGAHEVNAVAIRFAEYLLEHPEIADDYVAEVDEGRAALVARSRSMGLETPPSATNFQLVGFQVGQSPARIARELRAAGYLVSGPSEGLLGRFLRVTVGPPALMHQFCDALEVTLRAS